VPFPYHAMSLRVSIASFPFDLHCVAVFDSHIPCHAMPMPRSCRAPTMPFRKRLLKATTQHGRSAAWARHGMCAWTSAVGRRPVGDLPRFGSFRLPRGVPRRLLSESQTEMQLVNVKPSSVCHGRGEADYFGARTWVLYKLQHKSYDTNLVNNSIWRP